MPDGAFLETIGQKHQLAAARGRRGMVFDSVKREQSDRDGSNRSWRS
jgi:hypothetical protein